MTPELREVAPGCWAWLRLPGSWGETNIGLVVGDRASTLIDTPWDRRLTRSMLAAFEPQIEDASIELLINTHADPDHWWGNAEVPGAEIIASATCAEAMRHEATPQRLNALKRLSKATARIPGPAGRSGRYLGEMLEPFALDDIDLRFPDRTFTATRTETVGGRTLALIDFGAAHTASDSIVVVPAARVAYTGDLVFAGVTPVMWHGPESAWMRALQALMALEVDTFVPGHGPVSTRAELEALHEYWSWLSVAVAEHHAAGRGAQEISRALTATPEFRGFATWANPERLYINVATIRRHLDGDGPIPDNPIARGRAFDGVASLCGHLSHR